MYDDVEVEVTGRKQAVFNNKKRKVQVDREMQSLPSRLQTHSVTDYYF